MIYQCYFSKGQEPMLFTSDVYAKFGLEPQVNENIAKNTPELEDPSTRLSLTEYGAFLHIYKNDVWKFDSDDWIGFTSYRQLDKTPVMFKNKDLFRHLLNSTCDGFCGWGYYKTVSNAATQAEICHPGINQFIKDIFANFNLQIPRRFYEDKYLLFANYWAMRKEFFLDFMAWSWPIVEYAMTQKSHPYVSTPSPVGNVDTRKWLGYFMERLFLIWYMGRNYIPTNIGPICGNLA